MDYEGHSHSHSHSRSSSRGPNTPPHRPRRQHKRREREEVNYINYQSQSQGDYYRDRPGPAEAEDWDEHLHRQQIQNINNNNNVIRHSSNNNGHGQRSNLSRAANGVGVGVNNEEDLIESVSGGSGHSHNSTTSVSSLGGYTRHVPPGPASAISRSEKSVKMSRIPEKFHDEKDGSEIYVMDSAFPTAKRGVTPAFSAYSGKSRAPSEMSSVKTKTSRKGGVVVDTMSAPNPFCPNTRGVCCLLVLVNLGLILVTLGFSIVLQLFDPPFVWYCGIAFLIVGFIALIVSLLFCVHLCRESRESRRQNGLQPGELYWTHHWQKRIAIPGIGRTTERSEKGRDDLSTVYSARTDDQKSGQTYWTEQSEPQRPYRERERERDSMTPIHSYQHQHQHQHH